MTRVSKVADVVTSGQGLFGDLGYNGCNTTGSTCSFKTNTKWRIAELNSLNAQKRVAVLPGHMCNGDCESPTKWCVYFLGQRACVCVCV